MSESDVLTSVARPNTSATLTIRIIKSFTFRTERSLVLHDVNLVTMTVVQLKEIAKQSMFDIIQSLESQLLIRFSDVVTHPGWKPYRNVVLGPFSFEYLSKSLDNRIPWQIR
jgi:hypothetical protein